MENLTLLEQEALEILKQLEYRCESIELHNPEYVKEKKILEITFGDLNLSVLKKGENIYDIAKYLQKNGLDFSITFDLINKFPDMYIDDKHPTDDFIQLGIIKGENIQVIKTRIRGLIDNLSHKKPIKPELKIKHNINLGQLIFNDDVVPFEGKQKDTLSCLVSKGKDVLVSWDEIYELFNDLVTDRDIPNSVEIDSHKRSVRTAITEINSKTNKYFQPNNELIGAKNNEYWLQYEVDKGR